MAIAWRRIRPVASVALSALLVAGSAAAEDDVVEEVLSGLVADVTALTEMPEAAGAQRADTIRRILDDYFNLPIIGRAVLGRYWRTITDSQKDAYLAAFEGHTVRLIDSQLGLISGGSLQILRTVPRNRFETVVYSRFNQEGEEPLEVQWRLRNRKADGAPRVVDVAIEGVSLFATRREDFAATIESDGIDGLVEALQRLTETSL